MSENKMTSEPDAVLSSVRRLVTQVARSGPADGPGESDPQGGSAAGQGPAGGATNAGAPGAAAETPAPADAGGGHVEKLLLTPSLRVEDEAQETVAESRRPAHGPTPTLEQRIAELEAAVGGRDEEWEPDGSELVDEETPRRFVFQHTPRDSAVEPTLAPAADEEPQESPVERADASGPAPDAAIEGAAVEAPQATPEADADGVPSLSLSEESVIDEDMLRELVSEIVRSELQGELGERITRNVRKLVRREIHRAIMTRDFG